MNWKRIGWIMLASLLVLPLGGSPFAMAKSANSGKAEQDLYVSVRWLPLHERPTGLSKTTVIVGFGTAVKVLETFSASSKIHEKDRAADWALVECLGDARRGYAPLASLVDRKVLDREDPSQAMQKIARHDVSVSGKGFTESEEGDLKAMKGLAGTAATSVADEAAIDSILSAPCEYDPCSAYTAFRKEGKTGEYSGGSPQ